MSVGDWRSGPTLSLGDWLVLSRWRPSGPEVR